MEHRGNAQKLASKALGALLALLIVLFPATLVQVQQAVYALGSNISDNSGSSTVPQIAVSDSGTIYAVWVDNTEGNNEVYLARSTDNGETFDAPVNLSENSGSSITPQIAISGDNVYVVWRDNSPGYFDIMFRVSTDEGSSFDPVVNLNEESTMPATAPKLAVSGDNVYVVWENTLSASDREIYFRASTDSGSSFAPKVDLSNNTGLSTAPQIAAVDSGIFVIWNDKTGLGAGNSDILLMTITSDGSTFGTAVNVSDTLTQSINGKVAASPDGSIVHVSWQDLTGSGNNDILVRTSTDGGETFGITVNISNNPENSINHQMAVSPSSLTVYFTWSDNAGVGGDRDIFFARSTDNGETFDAPVNLSDNALTSDLSQIATSGSDVFVIWQDLASGSDDVLFKASEDEGATFGSTINISDTDSVNSRNPQIAATLSADVYAVWEEYTSSNPDISFSAIDHTVRTIEILDISSDSPAWGSKITVSGTTTNADPDSDTVTVDWGDGTPANSTIPIDDEGLWGPIAHNYSSSAISTNPNQIMATLVDSSDTVLATSSPSPVDVQKHQTSLSLDPILSVLQGEDIIVSGTLSDIDATPAERIGSATITFTGTGAALLPALGTTGNAVDAVPEGDLALGVYNVTGLSPDSVASMWTVQAHFAGDDLYLPSDSKVQKYDTLDGATTSEFDVPEGSPHVELDGFGASIDFDDITSGGKIFVASCDAPESSRYVDIGLCMKLILAAEMAPDSFAHLTVSYDGVNLPEGRTASEIDIFHRPDPSEDTVIDITESRDLEGMTVTGRTADFSQFIVAVAEYVPPLTNPVVRQQAFVGDNQQVAFRIDPTNADNIPTIAINGSQYAATHSIEVIVTDGNANLNSSSIDTVLVRLSANNSESADITIQLTETDKDTGIFAGSFIISHTGPSTFGVLQAQDDEKILINYASGRLNATLDGVSESGLVEMGDYDETQSNLVHIVPVGGAVEMQFFQTKLLPSSDGGKIRVTMSYANAYLFDDKGHPLNEMQLDLYKLKSDLDWEIITLADGRNLSAKTITGETASLGKFIIGYPREPGGGGGGLNPGAGIVLDFVASSFVHESDDGGNDNSETPSEHHNSGRNGGGSVVVVSGPSNTQTFPPNYFDENPLAKVGLSATTFANAATGENIGHGKTGQQINISHVMTNYQQNPQNYAYIIQVIDQNGFAVSITWQEGILSSGETSTLTGSWTPQETGKYTIKVFVWDGIASSPIPLSDMAVGYMDITG